MSKKIQRRRGTTLEHTSFTGAQGEITIDTDKDVVVVHDGLTPGGFPQTKAADLAASSGASLVGYLPSGTGAVATTVQGKLGESVSVKDFGAVGDGVTDDAVAIQAAVNSGYYNIFFPASTYLIQSAITIPQGITLFGADRRRTVIRAGASNAVGIFKNVSTAQYHTTIKNLSIDANGFAPHCVQLGSGSAIGDVSAYINLINVEATGATNANFKLTNVQYINIDRCLFQTAPYDIDISYGYQIGIYESNIFDGATTALRMSNCFGVFLRELHFYGPFPTGGFHYLHITSSNHVYASKCTFENEAVFTGALVAMDATGTGNTTNIHFDECLWQGLAFAQDLISIATGCYDVAFKKCRAIKPSGGKKILVNDAASTNVLVLDCYEQNGYEDTTQTVWSSSFITTGGSCTTIVQDSSDGQMIAWNPSVLFGGASAGTITNNGSYYAKQGKSVVCHADVTITTKSANTGEATVGVPIATSLAVNGAGSVGFSTTTNVVHVQVSQDVAKLRTSTYASATDASFANGDRFIISFSYGLS